MICASQAFQIPSDLTESQNRWMICSSQAFQTPSDLAKRQNRWRFAQVRYHKPAPEKPANTKHLKKGPAAQRGSPFNVP